MKPWHATELLEVWDAGHGLHSVDRALMLLAVAYPEHDWDSLCALPVGERNRLLLQARAVSFGPRLDVVSACPACGEQVEFEFRFPIADFEPTAPAGAELTLQGGANLRWRLPNSLDLAAIAGAASSLEAQRELLSRCIAGLELDPGTPAELRALAEQFSQEVEQHDPLASIAFPLRCTGCETPWRASLDPVEYIWQEVSQRVRVLIHEVDAIARVYGWSEREILSLTPARRRLYCDQVRA
ncbi:MAG TPA: hypothetical protein VNN80_16460 [Polyangiaceae bacterium]|nr:hypothetical protein [Polyangiaceae bacterium]